MYSRSAYGLTAAALNAPTRWSLVLMGLPHDFTADELLDRVSEYVRPTFCRVLSRSGVGFVSFESAAEAETVLTGFRRRTSRVQIEWADAETIQQFVSHPLPDRYRAQNYPPPPPPMPPPRDRYDIYDLRYGGVRSSPVTPERGRYQVPLPDDKRALLLKALKDHIRDSAADLPASPPPEPLLRHQARRGKLRRMTPDEAIARAGGWGNFLTGIVERGREAFPDIGNGPPPIDATAGPHRTRTGTTVGVFVAESITILSK
jgi:hypothetical protein